MKEQRRIYAGSTYWLRTGYGLARGQWLVTADGIALCAPTDYANALAMLNAVAEVST